MFILCHLQYRASFEVGGHWTSVHEMRVLMSVVVCVLMQVGALSGPTRGVVGQERRGNTDARTRDAGTISIDTLSLPESAKSLKSLKSVAPHPLPVHVQPPLPVQTPVSHAVLTALTNVKGALGRVYGLQDSTLTQMASLHLLDSAINDSTYHGVYMTMVRNPVSSSVALPPAPTATV